MGNRVEDLETQVAELQAAVDGLTEELVESKERLRQLENATDPSADASADEDDSNFRDAHAEFVANADSKAGSGADAADDREPTPDGERTDEESEESDDSIIVA